MEGRRVKEGWAVDGLERDGRKLGYGEIEWGRGGDGRDRTRDGKGDR